MALIITWPRAGICQNTHTVAPSAEIWADSILKKPLEMLVQRLIPLIRPMFNTKTILNNSVRYLNILLKKQTSQHSLIRYIFFAVFLLHVSLHPMPQNTSLNVDCQSQDKTDPSITDTLSRCWQACTMYISKKFIA